MLTNLKRRSKQEGPSQAELKNLLKNQIDSIVLKTNESDFLSEINCIDQTISLLDDDPDPMVFSMVGGYVKEFVTSFLILYLGTRDLEKSLEAHKIIKSLTKYIVLLDKHYDEKSYEYKARADIIFNGIMKEATGYVRNAIKHNMASLWTIASYEIKLRGRMLNREVIEKAEIRYHLMQKSSDTVLYSVILDKYVERFNPNVMHLLHYNQALLDIQDDWNDIEEDRMNHDLNIFFLASAPEISITGIFGHAVSTDEIKTKSAHTILSIIDDFEKCIDGITVTNEFSFMKILSKSYINTLREAIKEIQ